MIRDNEKFVIITENYLFVGKNATWLYIRKQGEVVLELQDISYKELFNKIQLFVHSFVHSIKTKTVEEVFLKTLAYIEKKGFVKVIEPDLADCLYFPENRVVMSSSFIFELLDNKNYLHPFFFDDISGEIYFGVSNYSNSEFDTIFHYKIKEADITLVLSTVYQNPEMSIYVYSTWDNRIIYTCSDIFNENFRKTENFKILPKKDFDRKLLKIFL